MTSFKHLNVPDQWNQYFTKYPQGYTILEALMNWVQQVDDMVDNVNDWNSRLDDFIAQFDTDLQDTVSTILNEWLEDGVLFSLLDEAYGSMKTDFEQSFHYDEITTQQYVGAQGVYYVTTIPTVDKKGKPIYLEKGFANDSFNNGLETTSSYADRHHTSLSINASTFNTTTGHPLGIHIKDGVVLQNTNQDSSTGYTLAYNRNTQELKAFPPNVDGNTLKNTYGITDTWGAFFPFIDNHLNVGSDVWGVIGNTADPNPRQAIAQLDDKTVLVFTFRGREDDHLGYTYSDMQAVCQSFNVKFAYCLDGGGSTATVKDNILINVPIDSNYSEERQVMDFINVIKPTNKAYEEFYKTVGDLSQIVRKLDARHISKYGDEIPGRLTFKDFMYLALDKAIYGTNETGDVKRLLGLYTDSAADVNGRAYLGNIDTALSIQASNNIIVTLGNNAAAYRVNLVETAAWKDVTLTTGITHMSNRKVQYKKINAFETRIRGAAVVGTAYGLANQLLFTLPTDCAPIQTMVIPVTTLAGGRENNDVIINTDGTVLLRFATSTPTASTAIQIECTINKEA